MAEPIDDARLVWPRDRRLVRCVALRGLLSRLDAAEAERDRLRAALLGASAWVEREYGRLSGPAWFTAAEIAGMLRRAAGGEGPRDAD